MKRESVLEKLNAIKDGQDPSEVLDWLMNENGTDINSAKASVKSMKDELSGVKAELDAMKKDREAAEAATLSKEELLERQINEYKAKEAELAVKTNRVNAGSRLASAGISTEDAEKLLDHIVSADSEATDKTVTAILEVMAVRTEAAEAAAKQKLVMGFEGPKSGEGKAEAVTKSQFDSMTYKERVELYEQSPELYAQFTQEGE